MSIEQNESTRNCLYCDRRLDPLIHGSRLFCPPPNDQQRSLGKRDCKVLHNNKKGKVKRDMTKAINVVNLKNRNGLHYFFTNKVFTVTEDDLKSRGVDSARYLSLSKDRSTGKLIYFFLQYALIQISTNQYKIDEHDYKF